MMRAFNIAVDPDQLLSRCGKCNGQFVDRYATGELAYSVDKQRLLFSALDGARCQVVASAMKLLQGSTTRTV